MTRVEKRQLEPLAEEFVKACNVLPFVSANEGGIIYLKELLVDFLDYKERKEKVDPNLSNLETGGVVPLEGLIEKVIRVGKKISTVGVRINKIGKQTITHASGQGMNVWIDIEK